MSKTGNPRSSAGFVEEGGRERSLSCPLFPHSWMAKHLNHHLLMDRKAFAKVGRLLLV
jgi:hypothetical protein